MSDLLRRIAARNRGLQKGKIRPVLPTSTLMAPATAELPARMAEARASARDNGPLVSYRAVRREPDTASDLPSRQPSTGKSASEAPAAKVSSSAPRVPQSAPSEAAVQVRLETIVESMPAPADTAQRSFRAETETPTAPKQPRRLDAGDSRGTLPPLPRPLASSQHAKPTPVDPPAAPVVEISIGTVEVGVLPPRNASPTPPVRRPKPSPRLSLDAYLHGRNRPATGGPS